MPKILGEVETVIDAQAEIDRLSAEVIRVRTEYEQLEIHNIKLDAKIAKLRAALEAIVVSDDPVTVALKALAHEQSVEGKL